MRTKTIVSAVVCSLLCISVSAAPAKGLKSQPERAGSTHYIGPYLMGGYDNMIKSDSHLRNIGGPMGGLGAAYQFRYGTHSKGAFLLNAGLEAQYGMNIRKGTFHFTRRVLYPSYEMFMGYQFRNLKETQTALDLSLSLMAGGIYRGMFFLGGVRLGYPVGVADYTIISDVDRVIYDARGIDNYTQMPQHLLASDHIESKGSLAKRFNPFLALEVGYDFHRPTQAVPTRERNAKPQKKSLMDYMHMQLSAFVHIGLSDYKASSSESLVAFDGSTGIAQMQSTSNAAEFAGARTIPLLAGLKFALMFELPSKRPQPKAASERKPYIVTYVRDEVTDLPIAGATVTTRSAAKSKKKKKPIVRTTDERTGGVTRSYAPGKYVIEATADGYFPSHQMIVAHGENDDTVRVMLYPQRLLRSQTVDAKTQRTVTAQVTLFTEQGDTIVKGRLDSVETMLSAWVDDRQQYYACVTAEGYRDTCVSFLTLNDVQIIPLEPIQVKRFVLRNLFFATDKTTILPSSEEALQELYTLLKDYPEISIRIVGHTDDTGKDEYNLRLSEGRANSVKNEMLHRGIEEQRIETEGRGETDPIVPNDTDEHRQMNRRVEIEIIRQ